MEDEWRSGESREAFEARFRASPKGQGVFGRAKVDALASEDPEQALQLARTIQHPWYRCQAITSIVEKNPFHLDADALLDEAMSAAFNQPEPNRVASVAFWPLRQMVLRSSPKAEIHVSALLGVISKEPHGLRRLDGLRAILTAVAPSEALRACVLPVFRVALDASQGWRTERILDVVATVLMPFDKAAAAAILGSRAATRFTRRVRGELRAAVNPDRLDEP